MQKGSDTSWEYISIRGMKALNGRLNNFKEYTMMSPDNLAEYVGFTEQEVKDLCGTHGMDFDEFRKWYDGYYFKETGHIYSPKSVVDALTRKKVGDYWTRTETYESVKNYIVMNFDGLKEAVVGMVGGCKIPINAGAFQNDMTSLNNKEDVMALLVHLGYLAYDSETQEVFIPNEEVCSEIVLAIKNSGWDEVAKAIGQSGITGIL